MVRDRPEEVQICSRSIEFVVSHKRANGRCCAHGDISHRRKTSVANGAKRKSTGSDLCRRRRSLPSRKSRIYRIAPRVEQPAQKQLSGGSPARTLVVGMMSKFHLGDQLPRRHIRRPAVMALRPGCFSRRDYGEVCTAHVS